MLGVVILQYLMKRAAYYSPFKLLGMGNKLMIFRKLLAVIAITLGLSAFTLVHAQTNKAFDISITTLDGESTTLNQLVADKPVYLKFWATWCQPCREQMPHLQQTFEHYGDEIDIISVNIDVNDSVEAINATQQEFGLTVPVVIDATGKLAQAFDLVGTPYHLLIDTDGRVVFKGHEESDKLEKTLKLLSASNSVILPAVEIESLIEQPSLVTKTDQLTALFFTATWCDWYLEVSRPAIANNCINGQQQANTLYKLNPQLNWLGITSRLWTGDKELAEYKGKYQIQYPLVIDNHDQEFVRYQVKDFPTLILLKDGKEVFRTSEFSNQHDVATTILKFK